MIFNPPLPPRDPLPSCADIATFSVGVDNPEDYHPDWIDQQGEILLKIICSDGLVFIVRKEFLRED